MHGIAQNTTLGPLEIVEVYQEYDGPKLFSCRRDDGQLFLAVAVDDSETAELWLYVPLSERRLEDLHAGRVELRDAFTGSEAGSVFQVSLAKDGTTRIESLATTDIPATWLPARGEFLGPTD